MNIMSTAFTHIGIAVFRDCSGTVWLTQDFSLGAQTGRTSGESGRGVPPRASRAPSRGTAAPPQQVP